MIKPLLVVKLIIHLSFHKMASQFIMRKSIHGLWSVIQLLSIM
ncbi:hypothetical protein VMUT_0651 [Vulcanisaeta moutnovskia 768-28]|uniref:Uncharacterized protein n=1 Tax=Vulcanisaeta moutnovskia (strain 768-28) TaxID=985053 RepID=F0QVK9_VULM7|nr:hypothetical protein VMUT_0651 [Vulcanisaeta moutnovskia 768-28]